MIGERLRELRELRGWSVADLAAAAGLTKGSVSHIEAGRRRNPYWRTVDALARALRVAPSMLMDEEETR